MSRYKAHREPRRRGFDDDNYTSRDCDRNSSPRYVQHPSPVSAPARVATATWVKTEKGTGVLRTHEGSEVFKHIRPPEAAGHSSIPAGAPMKVKVGQGQKGPQAVEVLEVDLRTAQAPKPPPSSGLQ